MVNADELTSLRRSVELESQADLLAIACDFGEAARLMREANRLREHVFGKFDPNDLRERTADRLAALSASRMSEDAK